MQGVSFFRRVLAVVACALLAVPAVAQAVRPVATDVQATASGANKITVTWALPKADGQVVTGVTVYRSLRAFTKTADLSDSLVVARLEGGALSFADTVSDYREYFYVVIVAAAPGNAAGSDGLFYDEQLDGPPTATGQGTAYLSVLPGVNATVRGVRVALPGRDASAGDISQKQRADEELLPGQLRGIPLAYIELDGGQGVPQSTMSHESHLLAQSLYSARAVQAKTQLEPYVFEDDLMMPERGTDAFRLFDILRASFIQGNYERSARDLRLFLLSASGAEAERARFYLGESYYFMREYDVALTYFLAAGDFSPLVRRWSESALDLFSVPQEQ